jgi:uncharacterized protein (TIGR04145 family)
LKKLVLILMVCCGILWLNTIAVRADSGNSRYGITIDGNFNDWHDISKTEIKENGDDYNIKQGALVADDDDIYIYINMSPKHGNGYSTLQPAGYVLKVGKKVYYLTLKDTSVATNATKAISVDAWESDSTGGNVSGQLSTAQGAVHRYKTTNGTNDVAEVKIPLSTLKVANTSNQSISLTNANLGTQTLTATGGSTGPVVLASVGFILAIGGVLAYTKRKKLRI